MWFKRANRPSHAVVDDDGRLSLHYAAAEGENAQVQALLRAGANPNLQDHQGWSPLHAAAQSGSPSVVQSLLAAGANVRLQDVHGNTPLFRAVFSSLSEGEIIQLLRSSGADPHTVNNSGVSPLELARTTGNFDVSQHFSDLA